MKIGRRVLDSAQGKGFDRPVGQRHKVVVCLADLIEALKLQIVHHVVHERQLRDVAMPQQSFMDNMMHDLKLERFYRIGKTYNDLVTFPDGPIKTFTLRGIKDSPPYFMTAGYQPSPTRWNSSTSFSERS